MRSAKPGERQLRAGRPVNGPLTRSSTAACRHSRTKPAAAPGRGARSGATLA